ncbi:MAG TPA: phosphate ABC transporter permease PstA [Thermotogota bacterium]|nr:phosphate ABC transporter permease PstA [Thermotogota bacterium]
MKTDLIISTVFRIISYAAFLVVIAIFATTILDGMRYFSLDFFFKPPLGGMTSGGIFPAILGSLYILSLTMLIAIPIGMMTGIYLSEYGRNSKSAEVILTAITSLAGVPSVVYGLFGLALFSIAFGFRTSILSGSLTLSIMTLPVISSAVQEALSSIPRDIRESAYALGANKTEVIFKVLIPYAKLRILTAVLIGGGRAIGETAPVLLTGAIFYATSMPSSVFDPTMTMPTHIYYITMAYGENAQWMAKGTISVLMIFVLILYSFAFALRKRLGKEK